MFDNLVVSDIPARAEALRTTVRDIVATWCQTAPTEVRARSWQGYDAGFSRELGRSGLLGLALPEAYGGKALGPLARFVVIEELLSAGAPVAAHWIADRQSSMQILHYGTEAQRDFFLPRIARGELYFCIGMSEPGSGSDLASVRTRAEPAANGWILNGQKIWTTHGHLADYMIALVRTSGTPADRHQGLSQIIVDLRLPGITRRPIPDLVGDQHFSEIFFDNVEISGDALLGQEGLGWDLVTAELAFERSGPERLYSSIILLDAWVAHLAQIGRADAAASKLCGELTAQFATARAMSLAVTNLLEQGLKPVVEASLVKDFGTSFEQAVPTLIAEDLGAHPDEPVPQSLAAALFYVSHVAPSFSLRGGTREVLRGILARGLGLR